MKTRSREKPEIIADELRALIVSGEVAEGESLGREPDLVERFGVSRPSLREALRILEAEGLITVVRGVLGGVVVRAPDVKGTARTASILLASRNVSVGDVHDARSVIEPAAARILATSTGAARPRSPSCEAWSTGRPRWSTTRVAFGAANAEFHERLVVLAGNQTLAIVAEMLNEVVARVVTEVSREPQPPRLGDHPHGGASGRRSACSSSSASAPASRPRSTGGPTWPRSAR